MFCYNMSNYKVSGTTPTEAKSVPASEQFLKSSYSVQTEMFLQNIAENKLNEPLVKKFMQFVNEFCQEHHINIHLNLSGDHPVEEIGWLVLIVFIILKWIAIYFLKLLMIIFIQILDFDTLFYTTGFLKIIT